MNQEIIEMARDFVKRFGVRMCDEHGNTHDEELYAMGVDDVIDIIKLVAAKEREACAIVCDGVYYQNIGPEFGEVRHGIAACAKAIRARSTQ